VKIFKFPKAENYREEELAELKIAKDKEFKCVVITNPTDSNRIYIIDKITFHNCKYNEINFYSYEDLKNMEEDSNFGSLKINFKVHEGEDEDKLLLYRTKTDKSSGNKLIDKEYFVVLPGGSLFIEMSNWVKDGWLKLAVGEELI